MQTVWLYAPTVTPAYRDQFIGPNVLGDEDGAEVKLVSAPALAGKDVGGHTASISSTAIVKPSDPKYNLVPGRRFEKGKPPATHVPDAITEAVKDYASRTNTENAAARLTTEAKAVSKFIPGARSPMRGAQTVEMQTIAGHISPNAEVGARMSDMLRRTR
jgi:hypothetical protein